MFVALDSKCRGALLPGLEMVETRLATVCHLSEDHHPVLVSGIKAVQIIFA